MLVDEMGVHVNLRDAKGWTPIAVAAFHGHKQVCRELMGRKADPSIPNAYRKDAHDVAKDDEIKEVLRDPFLFLGPGAPGGGGGLSAGDLPGAVPEEDDEKKESEPKAKAKGKAKAK